MDLHIYIQIKIEIVSLLELQMASFNVINKMEY